MKSFTSCLSVSAQLLLALMFTATALNAAPPVINSPLSDEADVGDFYIYAITATESPTVFATGTLPPGLNRSGNVISGTPTTAGSYSFFIYAENADGSDTETLKLDIADPVPVITSPASASGNVGTFFEYTIIASNNPSSFSAAGVNAFPGLTFDGATGVISGTPTSAASGDIILTASNSGGDSIPRALNLTIGSSNSVPPEIISGLSLTVTLGDSFTYFIDAINNPVVYGISGDPLPEGVSRSGRVISGIPAEVGTFNIDISATNSFGTDTETLVLEVIEPRPEIVSLSSVVGELGEDFLYQITSTTRVDTYTAVGLGSIGGLTLDSTSGLITGIPSTTGSFDVLLGAENSAGTDSLLLTVFIIDSDDTGGGPLVEILTINGQTPASSPEFDSNTDRLDFVVEVTPESGQTLESIFVQWTNVPVLSGFNSVIVAELQPQAPIPATGPVTYVGSADIGFDPSNREVGGGQIELEVVAIQRSDSNSEISSGTSDQATVEIEPLVEFLLPEEDVSQGSIPAGNIFTAVRLSTNAFQSITASISGVGVIENVVDDNNSDNPNGVYTFRVSSEVSFPDVYNIVVRAEDSLGNLVQITRELEITNETSSPVAVVASPSPGFRNDVFSPGSFSWTWDDTEIKRNDAGIITETTHTYTITSVSRGQGYYPRNESDARLFYTFFDASGSFEETLTIDGNTVENGRVTVLPETVSIRYVGFEPRYGDAGVGVLDRYQDSGFDSRIGISADLFRADADLESFRLFVNGIDVTPGSGNLNISAGPISVPALIYPSTGVLSPGEYIITAEVTDQNGEVGVSDPLLITIDAFEELEVIITTDAGEEVAQGDTVTYLVSVEPNDSLDTVEIFDSVTNESLGTASRVTVDGNIRYRFTRTYDEAGVFGIYALATTFSGQQVISNQISQEVVPFNDAVVAITSPEGDTTVVLGQSLTLSAEASATPGIASITWFVNNNPVQTVEESSTSYNFISGAGAFTQGTYNITVSAIDNFGNTVGSNESIEVKVVASDVAVTITASGSDLELFEGAELEFSASASATTGVAAVEWFVDGDSVEVDSESPYSLTQTFFSVGSYSINAVATDELGNTASSSVITVTIQPSNPLLRDEDFVTDIYERLLGISPTTDQLADAAAVLDGTLASRSQYVVDLLETDAFENTIAAFIVYRTMTGEWPNNEESESAISDLFGEFSQTTEFTGTVPIFGDITHTLELNSVGTLVRATVEGNNSNGIGLADPTLLINGPQGFIGYSDNIFGSFEEINFNVGAPGTHFFIVGGWSISAGEYTLTVEYSGEDGVGDINGGALVSALQEEYVERFGEFDVGIETITQLFKNKHAGVAPTSLTLTRLLAASLNDDSGNGSGNGSSDFISFVGDFALDNDVGDFENPDGLPLTTELLYGQPNNPEEPALLAALISRILGVQPTNAAIANLAANSLAESVELVLTDERYFNQFDTSNTEGAVARYMAGFGVFDITSNTPSADPDGDGFNNEAEFAGGTNPTDASDFPDNWYSGAAILGNGWRYFDWFKGFLPQSESDWIYHGRHGWFFVVGDDTSALYMWDPALGRWMFTNATVYPWMYAYGADGGWVFFFEGGSPGNRYFEHGESGQTISEQDLSLAP